VTGTALRWVLPLTDEALTRKVAKRISTQGRRPTRTDIRNTFHSFRRNGVALVSPVVLVLSVRI
jgi:hypothetical protein